jgi:hypothetical protein
LEEHIAKKRKLEATRNNRETERAPTVQTSNSGISSQVRPVAERHAEPAAANDLRPAAAKLPSKVATTAEAKPVYRNISAANQIEMKPTATISNRLSTGSNRSHSMPVLQVMISSITLSTRSSWLMTSRDFRPDQLPVDLR